MNKIILASVLLAALNVAPSFSINEDVESRTPSYLEKWDEEMYKKCFEDEIAQLSQFEIPSEVLKAREYFSARGEFCALNSGRETYFATLSEQEQSDLISAATKFVSETYPIIYGGQCKGSLNYRTYLDKHKAEPSRKEYYDMVNAEDLAEWITNTYEP